MFAETGTNSDYLHLYFKVNDYKLSKPALLKRQANLVINYMAKKYNITNKQVSLKHGSIKDDFINGIFRLRISFYKPYKQNKPK